MRVKSLRQAATPIKAIGNLRRMTDEELLRIPGLGTRMLQELRWFYPNRPAARRVRQTRSRAAPPIQLARGLGGQGAPQGGPVAPCPERKPLREAATVTSNRRRDPEPDRIAGARPSPEPLVVSALSRKVTAGSLPRMQS